jgi:hypothetical protein
MKGELRDSGKRLAIHCPGCGFDHEVVIDGTRGWKWNGSVEKPTITPSILVQWTYGDPPVDRRCHSFVTDGRIRFLEDCTHSLAGQEAELPDIERAD